MLEKREDLKQYKRDDFNIEKNEENNQKNEDLKCLSEYIEHFSKINGITNGSLSFDEKPFSFILKYTDKIIVTFLNENDNISKKILINKKISRNILYLIKLLKNNNFIFINKTLTNNCFKNLHIFFIIFIYNILKHVLEAKNNYSNDKKNKEILQLYLILNKILNTIGISYLNNTINDNIFESILKFLLFSSLTKTIENPPSEKDEITNMMFFKSCIDIIKMVFNKISLIQLEYTERQKLLLNNIILFINKYILGTLDKKNDISYINRVFLSKNDYKTSSLIDLTYILLKTKSKDFKNNFINLLADIYSFSFSYENCMRPILQLLEPLFININKKNLNQIKNELSISDFSISLLNSFINKEKTTLNNNSYLLKEGFYFGSKLSGIICEINSLENEFILMMGFKLESSNLNNILLFDMINNTSNTSQVKFYLVKRYNNKDYNLFVDDEKGKKETKIVISTGKTYIFTFHFNIKGSWKGTSININYVKDEDLIDKEEYIPDIKSGLKIKIKNMKSESLNLYIGCGIQMREGNVENAFKGYIGDIFIFNIKNFKDKNGIEFNKYLLNLQRHYSNILSIFSENLEEFDFNNNIENDPNYLKYKEKIKEFNDNDNKLFKSIKLIISPKYFKAIEYQDDIDYMNLTNNYENYLQKKETIFKFKKKYIDFKLKYEASEENKIIQLNTSLFDKNFHTFENKMTLIEFIKYDGIHYLCLLLEYYYQILSQIYEIKVKYDNNEIKEICKDISQNIINILKFFNINIIQSKLYLYYWKETNQFFYQLAVTLSKYMEIDIINIEVIKFLIDMINYFNRMIDVYMNNEKNLSEHLLMRKNLFDFLLNPNFYKKEDELLFENLNFTFLNLLFIVKLNTGKDKIIFMKSILQIEILNKLFSFIWLLDNKDDIINSFNNDHPSENKNYYLKFFEKAKQNYILLLIEFLQSSFPKNKDNIKYKSDNNLIQITDKKTKKIDTKSSKKLFVLDSKNILLDKSNEEEEKYLINYFIDKMIEQRKNHYIFYNMTNILINTNLIEELEETEIDKIKYILIKELKEKEEKNDENKEYNDRKKILYLSCLHILIEFFLSSTKNNVAKSDFHLFIRGLNINQDIFHSLIYSIKYIKDILLEYNDFEIIQKNEKFKNINNIGDAIKDIEKNDLPSFSGLPFMEIDILKINANQATVINNILEDIIYLLYKYEKNNLSKKQTNTKSNDSFNSSISFEQNIGKEIFESFKKNLEIIFKFPQSELYKKVFSSESEICAELFYLKWKIYEENGNNYIETVLTRYHNNLLKNHNSSFIFKFIFFISNENILPFESNNDEKDKKKTKVTKLKVNLMIFIIETLFNFQKEVKEKKENMNIYINNLLNFLVLLNEELDYNNNKLFKNNKLCESLYKFISLIEKIGLLYSNFYIECNESYGKLICETIYDIFFVMPDSVFNEEKFIKTFSKINHKEGDVFTIFYLIDLCRDNILEKETKVKGELEKYIPSLGNLKYFHKNYFINNRTKLFLGKKLYPIEDVNFSMYFIAKSFIYLSSNLMKNDRNKLKNVLLNKFLILLIRNIFFLSTKRKNFYGNKRCPNFPLYNYTKKYFELSITQYPNDCQNCKNFFETDMKINLKEEYNIYLCYSSRLLHEIKRVKQPILSQKKRLSKTNVLNESINSLNKSSTIKEVDLISDNSSDKPNSSNSLPILSTKSTYFTSLKDLSFTNKNSSFANCEDFDSSKSNNDLTKLRENEDNALFNSIESIDKNYIIYKPKKYFFNIIFSEIYKNLAYNDKTFKKIKNTYLIKFRYSKDVHKESKQTNYPTKQKNFSNILEPRIFLKRDSNFYDKDYFRVSNSYIQKDILNKNIESFFFYKHDYKFRKDGIIKFLFCELVTRQFIYFGKIYFLDNFIVFQSEEDPRNNINEDNEFEIFIKYGISTRNRDNITSKKKFILIFNDELKEIIQRRTALTSQSIEIFTKNGKSYFFNFFRKQGVDQAINYFNEINEKLIKKNCTKFIFYNDKNQKDLKSIISSFQNGKKSNYKYLLYLNYFSTRTYNDLSQYPVFPWLIFEHDKIEDIFNSLENNTNNYLPYLRDMNYPVSMQTKNNRDEFYEKYNNDETKYPFYLNKHYSTSGYIYYYLMRMNPYGHIMIKFQNFKQEDSGRIFNSYQEIDNILKDNNDGRELIPDIYCYFDFYCNLNCSYYANETNYNRIVKDDFNETILNPSKYINSVASFAYLLYRDRKLLNSTIISKEIGKWIDIIYGVKQLPAKKEEARDTCNIYGKATYEQKTNLEKKFIKYNQLIIENKIDKKKFIEKMKCKIDYAVSFGMAPRQILNQSISFEAENKLFDDNSKIYRAGEDIFIYFKKLRDNKFLILKKVQKKNKAKVAVIYDNKNFKAKDNNTFDYKSFNLYKNNKNYSIQLNNKNIKIPLYNLDYGIDCLYYRTDKISKTSIPVILTCRYYGNYFNLQSNGKSLNMFCEDFVTCIKGINNKKGEDPYFFTGLFNGKIIQWKINSILSIIEINHAYSHKSAITAVEIYSKQKIIITAGEDKFIHIRKIFDFELLTVIDLTYSFGNPIISQTCNIFPSLIRISELNLLYVLLYDYDTKSSFIRGYNLNGLFFAQTDEKILKDETNNSLHINNISFTKTSNLVVGFYNSNKYVVLQAWGLVPICPPMNLKYKEDNPKFGTKLIKYNYSLGLFYLLYDNEFIITTPIEKSEKKILDK